MEILGGELACKKLHAMVEEKKIRTEETREYLESEDKENTAYFRRQMAIMEEREDYDIAYYLDIFDGEIRDRVFECIYTETIKYLIEEDEMLEMRRFLAYGIHGLTLFNEVIEQDDKVLFEFLYEQKLKVPHFFFATLEVLESNNKLCPNRRELKRDALERFRNFKIEVKKKYAYALRGLEEEEEEEDSDSDSNNDSDSAGGEENEENVYSSMANYYSRETSLASTLFPDIEDCSPMVEMEELLNLSTHTTLQSHPLQTFINKQTGKTFANEIAGEGEVKRSRYFGDLLARSVNDLAYKKIRVDKYLKAV